MKDDRSFIQKLYERGRTETTTGNWIFYSDEFEGRTPEEVESLFIEHYADEMLDIETGENFVDVIFALSVCPNYVEDESLFE